MSATTIDTSQTHTFVPSPARPALTGLSFLASALISLAIAWPLIDGVAPGSIAQMIGWLGFVIFGIGTGIMLNKAFGTAKPVLTLSPLGFHYPPVSSDRVPWKAVTGLRLWQYRSTYNIIVEVTEDTWSTPGITRFARWMRPSYATANVKGFVILANGMPIPFSALAQVFRAYTVAHGGKVGDEPA